MNEPAANPVEAAPLPTGRAYVALALVSCATLMFEIVLTRIFSVTLWYHHAFLAISLAMFGMTIGALLVWRTPRGEAFGRLARWSLLFSLSILLSFFYHAYLPTNPLIESIPVEKAILLLLMYLVFSVPFVFSGMCICVALTRFPARVGRLYAADLLGASAGCLLVIYLLDGTDGPTTVVFSSLMAGAGAMFFALVTEKKKLISGMAVYCLVLAGFFGLCTALSHSYHPLLQVGWVKGVFERSLLYQKWNSFSRITVTGDPKLPEFPAGWGLSEAYTDRKETHQLSLQIDACAGTVLTEYSGQSNQLEHLKYDIVNTAHYLRPQSRVLVIGVGGGRDVLSALAFDQASVVGVEINEDILNALNGVFGEFTGHLDALPQVRFVNDEARSYIARSGEKYDIIQASLIDTWAASAAGAFVLAEHALYTTEAWANFIGHLTPRGILTFSRWYSVNGVVAPEIYRTVSLARAALLAAGTPDPRQHVVVIKPKTARRDTVATILVSRSPFTPTDLENLRRICQTLRWEVLLGPGLSAGPIWEQLINGQTPTAPGLERDTLDLTAPTDDRPFFFWVTKPWQLFHRGLFTLAPSAESTLVMALILVLALSAACFVLPFLLMTRRFKGRPIFSLAAFFLSIGCGFMFIEVAQMQRLIIFLGHPTYGLSVILFSLLLSSGLGSYWADRLSPGKTRLMFVLLLVAVGLVGLLSPPICRHFGAQPFVTRFALAVGLMFPAGFAMGMPFPLGMKCASPRVPSATPWLWGLNGAASVCASIVSVLVSLLWGISAAYATGFGCYVIAGVVFLRLLKPASPSPA